tara:strand:+ start:311 stop:2422 length:2112 start_codon:yes stop_codon:yes gene_type:complete
MQSNLYDLIEDILEDWAVAVEDGQPNPKNLTHILQLEEVLLERKYNRKAIKELIRRLMEKDLVTKDGGSPYLVKKFNAARGQKLVKKDASAKDAETSDTGEEEPKKKSKPKSKKLNPVDDNYYQEGIQPETDENGDYEGKPDDAPLKEGARPLTRKDIEKHFPPGIPKKYVDVLVRLLNASSNGGKDYPDMSQVLSGVGAGAMPAQAAEVFTMIAATMDDKQFNGLMDVVNTHHGNLENPKDAVFDKDWLQSISGARQVIQEMAKPNKISHCAWDTRDDVEAMGLPYDEKGFSTDAYFRTDDGRLIEVSLKKDSEVNFGQPSVGFVEEDAVSTLPENLQNYYKKLNDRIDNINKKIDNKTATKEERVQLKEYKERQERILRQGMNELYGEDNPANPFHAQDLQTESATRMGYEISEDEVNTINNLSDDDIVNMSGTQTLPRKAFPPVYLNSVKDMVASISPPITQRKMKAYLKENPDTKKLLKGGGDKYYAKAMIAYNKMLALQGNEEAKARVDRHIKVTQEFEKAFLTTTLDRSTPAGKVMYDNIMKLISEKFPLNSLMSGEEQMALGGLAATPEIFSSMFGDNPSTGKPYTYKELETKLAVEYVDPPGQHQLLFRANPGDKNPVTICQFNVRNKGKGYNSLNSSSLEMKVPDSMKRNLYCHNLKLAKQNGISEEEFRNRLSDMEKKKQDKFEKGEFGKCDI